MAQRTRLAARVLACSAAVELCILRQDLAVPQELYRAMAGRLDQPRVVDCNGPHEAMLTHPDLLAAALIDAVPSCSSSASRALSTLR
jgi:hypothetical protein